MVEAALALGSNLGDREAHLARAVQALSMQEGVDVTALSSLWETPPWGVEDQPYFLNGCVLIETTLSAFSLLELCLSIERASGRERGMRWGPRTLDVDIIFYGDTEMTTDRLTLPHPRMKDRPFVLAPLAEIAPAKVMLGRTVEDHLKAAGSEGLVRVGSLKNAYG